MTEYVVGFMFSPEGRNVVLLVKAKPAWMAGLLNGVGGKVEPGEMPLQAMVREFWEETGVQHEEWTRAGEYRSYDSLVHVYFTFSEKWNTVKTTTVEPVSPYYVPALNELDVIPNLRWLIPYLLDFDRSGSRGFTAYFGGTHAEGPKPAVATAA
jgi:8-oxo-dGTP diphosphatase